MYIYFLIKTKNFCVLHIGIYNNLIQKDLNADCKHADANELNDIKKIHNKLSKDLELPNKTETYAPRIPRF